MNKYDILFRFYDYLSGKLSDIKYFLESEVPDKLYDINKYRKELNEQQIEIPISVENSLELLKINCKQLESYVRNFYIHIEGLVNTYDWSKKDENKR